MPQNQENSVKRIAHWLHLSEGGLGLHREFWLIANSEILASLQNQYFYRGGAVSNNVLSVQDTGSPSISIQQGQFSPPLFPKKQTELRGMGAVGRVGQDTVGVGKPCQPSGDAAATLDSGRAGWARIERLPPSAETSARLCSFVSDPCRHSYTDLSLTT